MFMEGGEIVGVGTPEHFFTNPTEDRTKLEPNSLRRCWRGSGSRESPLERRKVI